MARMEGGKAGMGGGELERKAGLDFFVGGGCSCTRRKKKVFTHGSGNRERGELFRSDDGSMTC